MSLSTETKDHSENFVSILNFFLLSVVRRCWRSMNCLNILTMLRPIFRQLSQSALTQRLWLSSLHSTRLDFRFFS